MSYGFSVACGAKAMGDARGSLGMSERLWL